MILRNLVLAITLAGSLAAQSLTFLQMSDPQFGMFTNNKDFVQETINFEFAIASANRLKPAFIVITGDLINKGGDAAMTAEYHRIAGKLNSSIKLYAVPGNHDVENEPTPESLASYRKNFGPDYYSFRSGSMAGIILNSNLIKAPGKVQDDAAKMEAWLKSELAKIKTEGAAHTIVFLHHPFFLKTADEPEQYFNLPKEARARYLKILKDAGVRWIFAGHLHHNEEGKDGELSMITTGPVGKPLEGGKSGLRRITIDGAKVQQQFFDFGDLP